MSACSTSRSCSKARSSRLRDAVTEAWRWYPQAGQPVNRFFRSALFPLVIIAALVWLALQTLGSHSPKATPTTTSKVYEFIQNRQVNDQGVTIDPNKQSLSLTTITGGHYTVHYATPQAEAALEQTMSKSG